MMCGPSVVQEAGREEEGGGGRREGGRKEEEGGGRGEEGSSSVSYPRISERSQSLSTAACFKVIHTYKYPKAAYDIEFLLVSFQVFIPSWQQQRWFLVFPILEYSPNSTV